MQNRQQGFTLVELIVVIILLGILGVTATSRLMGKSSFTAHIARDQAISIARQIQIIAMQTDGTLNACQRLVVTNVSDEENSRFGRPAACSSNDDLFSDVLRGKQAEVTFATPVIDIYFNLLGRPVDADGKRICTTSSGCKVTVRSRNGETASLCINSEGFIHEGDCA
ncbi:prepilin-type N-terminal cleavage/methylation domain-containing protein [Photobacterium sp.]|uniref:prepilin-type N-terminal cleavage/methylation domain-containing protein n=1 Tax=Photobacterium sp. TaxID=660 RepID=UPI00299F1322|nr:prepilin-type N-terminal cleavage/methylation domain-containing protein [Photobacterium sp.]MDX1303796.1 prepilin-type N-terminal cleavage/methylation domain-containing protein [Photobacterium sp.]